MSEEARSDVERSVQECMDENEPLLDEGAVATLQKVVIQASSIFTKLSVEGVEAANSYAVATRVPTEAIRDPAAGLVG